MSFFSTTLTVPISRVPVTNDKPLIRRVSQMQIIVRSMGTATYVALGGSDSQDRRLTSVGSSVSIGVEGSAKYFDPLRLFVSSDTADAVIEIFGEAL